MSTLSILFRLLSSIHVFFIQNSLEKIKNNFLSEVYFLFKAWNTILILTGIGLLKNAVEDNRRIWSVLHWVIGICFLFFKIHIYFGKFKK